MSHRPWQLPTQVTKANLSAGPHKPGLWNRQGKVTRGDQVQLASHDTGLMALKAAGRLYQEGPTAASPLGEAIPTPNITESVHSPHVAWRILS